MLDDCKKNNMRIIGDIGFKGQPDEKKDIGSSYGLVEKEINIHMKRHFLFMNAMVFMLETIS